MLLHNHITRPPKNRATFDHTRLAKFCLCLWRYTNKLYGIEHGILAYSEAIAWADKVIESEGEPSGEIIDLALSRPSGRNGVLESLKAIGGERDTQLSGAKLFKILAVRLDQGEDVKGIAQKALNVSWATQYPEDVRFEFDCIDDEIALAEQGIYGGLTQCKTELLNTLKKYFIGSKT